jgi:uncharacterized integral membrane protein
MAANPSRGIAGRPGRSLGSQIRLAGTVLALLVLVVFIALNFSAVEVDLMIAETKIRLAFALLFAALMGFVVGYFIPKGHRQG